MGDQLLSPVGARDAGGDDETVPASITTTIQLRSALLDYRTVRNGGEQKKRGRVFTLPLPSVYNLTPVETLL
jgi:hypothetical protein